MKMNLIADREQLIILSFSSSLCSMKSKGTEKVILGFWKRRMAARHFSNWPIPLQRRVAHWDLNNFLMGSEAQREFHPSPTKHIHVVNHN